MHHIILCIKPIKGLDKIRQRNAGDIVILLRNILDEYLLSNKDYLHFRQNRLNFFPIIVIEKMCTTNNCSMLFKFRYPNLSINIISL